MDSPSTWLVLGWEQSFKVELPQILPLETHLNGGENRESGKCEVDEEKTVESSPNLSTALQIQHATYQERQNTHML